MYNAFDPDRTEVTGPFNAVRMEGEIDGSRKIVYMFMDFHMAPNAQTECSNVYSRDINKYLAETFYELNGADRVYDFFLEIYQGTYKVDSTARAEAISKQGSSRLREKYIWQVIDLMKSAVKYDKAGDRVDISEPFMNVRLHYLDIREVLSSVTGDLYRIQALDSLFSANLLPITLQLLEKVKKGVKNLYDIYQTLKSNPEAHNPIPDANSLYQAFAKSIRKVLYAYKHTNVQEVITKHLDRYFGELSELVSMIDDFIKVLLHYQPIINDRATVFVRDNGMQMGIEPAKRLEIGDDVQLRLVELRSQAMFAGVGITDCYLLRRLLDKEYITNAITYTGASHTINYISILAGDFGFRVTDTSFTRASSISELNSTITDRLAKGERITDLFVGDRLDQCSDLTDFPKRFT